MKTWEEGCIAGEIRPDHSVVTHEECGEERREMLEEIEKLRAAMKEASGLIDYCGECDRENDPCDTDRADLILKKALK